MGGNQSLTSSKYNENLHILQELEKIIFDLNEDNIDQIVENSLLYFSEEYPYSSHFIICRIVYAYFIKKGDEILCFKYLQKIEQETKYKMINIFINFLCANNFQETNYLLEKMYENEITERKIDQNIKSSYFIHYLSKEEIHILNRERFMKEISNNYEDLSKNDFKLHKELIKEGHNPNKIAKMIRNDEIEKLQEISSQTNFNFDQTIEPSLYERCSFINKDDVTLIDYAAFFSSIKCFKYLLMNGAKVENTGKYAIAGGNEEIIHLCEQNHSSFTEAYETAIEFHRNDIFHYLYENNIVEINNLEELGKICILHDNFNILSFLEKEGMIMNETLINESIITGNLFIFQYFQSKNPKSINFLEISGFCSNEELSNYLIKYKYIDLRNDKDKHTALIMASLNGRTEIVKLLLKQEGIDVNAKNKFRQTSLILATLNGYIKIVKLLLEQEGIDVNAQDDRGNTALIYASKLGDIEIVKLLLEQKDINTNVQDYTNGETPLMKASEKGNIEIVKLLLEQDGIDVNAKNKYGRTELINASCHDHTEIVQLLLEQKGININAKDDYEQTAIMLASSKGNIKIVQLLLEQKGIDISAKGNNGQTAFISASKNGRTEIVKILLEQEGIDINDKDNDGWTALMRASRNGHIEIVKLLLAQEGIDVNAKNKFEETALIKATEEGHTEVVKLLLEQKGIDINAKKKGYTSLMIASDYGYKEIVKLLLEQEEIDINTKDDSGNTALMKTSRNGHLDIVKLLLEQEGIDINAKDDSGETVLIQASRYCFTKIVKSLLKQKGIDINAKDKDEETALMKASKNGSIEIVKLLLEQEEIDINAKDKARNTALMYASSWNGYTEIVKLLLEQEGIDINAKNNNGETALILASANGKKKIVKILHKRE